MNYSCIVDCKIDRSSATLNKTNDQQRAVEWERLAFDREKYKEDRRGYGKDRRDRREKAERDRSERKQELENRDRLVIEKFKLMMEVRHKK